MANKLLAQLPWGHLTVLLDRLTTQPERDWCATAAAEHGWSRNVLLHQSQLHRRVVESTDVVYDEATLVSVAS